MHEKKLITRNYELVLRDLILRASKTIYILMFRFDYAKGWRGRKTSLIIHALQSSKHKNLDIKILLHKSDTPKKSDFRNIQTAKLFNASGIDVRWYPKTSSMHAKLILIDDSIVLCGSHNLTSSALWQNIETSILLVDPSVASQAKNFFLKLWSLSRNFD